MDLVPTVPIAGDGAETFLLFAVSLVVQWRLRRRQAWRRSQSEMVQRVKNAKIARGSRLGWMEEQDLGPYD